MNTLDYMKVASLHLSELKERGIDVRMSFDFQSVHGYVNKLGKSYLTPRMDPERNDFTETNGFWLLLTRNGKLIGGIAARMDDIGSESIGDFWQRSYSRHQPGTLGKAFSTIESDITDKLTGKVAYVGELFIEEENRGSMRVLENLLMLTHINIAVKWRPNWTYAFMWNKHVERGAAVRYGFTRLQQSVRRWKSPPDGRNNEEWLVALSGSDLQHKVRATLASIDGAGMVENELLPFPVADGQ